MLMVVTNTGFTDIDEASFLRRVMHSTDDSWWPSMADFKRVDAKGYAQWISEGTNHKESTAGISRDVVGICEVMVIDIITVEQIEQLATKYGSIEIKKSKYQEIPLTIVI